VERALCVSLRVHARLARSRWRSVDARLALPMRALVALVMLVACTKSEISLAIDGSSKTLRERPATVRPNSPDAPPVLVLALDGVGRGLLYAMLRAGELPNLEDLLGGDDFQHAYFEDTLETTFPSMTMPAWTSAFTGMGPAEHGVTGNEYFIRERRELA